MLRRWCSKRLRQRIRSATCCGISCLTGNSRVADRAEGSTLLVKGSGATTPIRQVALFGVNENHLLCGTCFRLDQRVPYTGFSPANVLALENVVRRHLTVERRAF